MTTIGLINPGAMGASVGAAARHNNAQVIWASEGRTAGTKDRADKAQLDDCGSLQNLVARSDIILSICPPHSAMAVATEVADLGFSRLYLEGNAIAPDHTRQIESVITKQGAEFIDGGIIGGPAWKAESRTRLYLSGDKAQKIADVFADSSLHASVISDRIGAASALKMTFAAFTKGSTALLCAILAVAEKEGVRGNLETQWGVAFTKQTHQRVIGNTAKAWRFEGEMQEIAATFSGAGLPPGFHEAAAQLFSSLAEYKDQQNAPTIEEVLATLLAPSSH